MRSKDDVMMCTYSVMHTGNIRDSLNPLSTLHTCRSLLSIIHSCMGWHHHCRLWLNLLFLSFVGHLPTLSAPQTFVHLSFFVSNQQFLFSVLGSNPPLLIVKCYHSFFLSCLYKEGSNIWGLNRVPIRRHTWQSLLVSLRGGKMSWS